MRFDNLELELKVEFEDEIIPGFDPVIIPSNAFS